MLDDVADIPGVITMTIIHPQPVPEPAADSNKVTELLQAGYAAETAGDNAAAIAHFRAAAAADPADAESQSALGQALAHAGHVSGATEALTRAMALEPRRSDQALLLAALLREQGRLDDAQRVLSAFLQQTPGSRSVQQALAEILGMQGGYESAVALGRELALSGALPEGFLKQFCDWLAHTGAHREAIQHLTRHVALHADDAAGWLQLGDLWLAVQEMPKATTAWGHYRTLCPDDPAQTAARLTGSGVPQDAALSPDYVRALFDGYADKFDQDLQGKLRYCVPELLHAAVGRVRNDTASSCDILDLGCGTGLCGKVFAARIRHLTGVDLSPKMLNRAAATGLYHDLVAADIVPWVRATEKTFDLVLAADVLVYLGDLDPLFMAVRRVLRPGGLFAGTVEQLPADESEKFLLRPQRRYAHAENYLTNLAKNCNFTLQTLEACTPRYESGRPVQGLLFVVT